ncbi:iron chaperone [Mucilaginibacter lutimaris]|uniref:Iron chaperone n=1 Tax=Mucilaginibacter lutimaris TaxID=931629 RepID=A0ABW2ZJF4_9SPHI
MQKPNNADEYIAAYPAQVQARMEELRRTIKNAAPQATEVISYGMPGYKINSVLVYFAGWDKHIGFYPGASGIASFKDELSVYKGAKGSVQFPLDEPLPLDLITRVVKFRVEEEAAIALARKMKKALK